MLKEEVRKARFAYRLARFRINHHFTKSDQRSIILTIILFTATIMIIGTYYESKTRDQAIDLLRINQWTLEEADKRSIMERYNISDNDIKPVNLDDLIPENFR